MRLNNTLWKNMISSLTLPLLCVIRLTLFQTCWAQRTFSPCRTRYPQPAFYFFNIFFKIYIYTVYIHDKKGYVILFQCITFLRFTVPWCKDELAVHSYMMVFVIWLQALWLGQLWLSKLSHTHVPTPKIALVHSLPSAQPSPSAPHQGSTLAFVLEAWLHPLLLPSLSSSPSLVAPYQTLHLWVFYCIVSL